MEHLFCYKKVAQRNLIQSSKSHHRRSRFQRDKISVVNLHHTFHHYKGRPQGATLRIMFFEVVTENRPNIISIHLASPIPPSAPFPSRGEGTGKG